MDAARVQADRSQDGHDGYRIATFTAECLGACAEPTVKGNLMTWPNSQSKQVPTQILISELGRQVLANDRKRHLELWRKAFKKGAETMKREREQRSLKRQCTHEPQP